MYKRTGTGSSDKGEVRHILLSDLIRLHKELEIDEKKVKSLMEALSNPKTADSVAPIPIVWFMGRAGGNYYFCSEGLHRCIAHQRLGLRCIKAKLMKADRAGLNAHLDVDITNLSPSPSPPVTDSE